MILEGPPRMFCREDLSGYIVVADPPAPPVGVGPGRPTMVNAGVPPSVSIEARPAPAGEGRPKAA
jgi:hypothetical protein